MDSLDEWLEKMKVEIESYTLNFNSASTSQVLFYLQQQIAITNQIKLKELELKYTKKDFPNTIPLSTPMSIPTFTKNFDKIKIT